MTEMKIRLALRFRVTENSLTVNGILQGLEEQMPMNLMAILEQIFKALKERTVMRLGRENPACCLLPSRDHRRIGTQIDLGDNASVLRVNACDKPYIGICDPEAACKKHHFPRMIGHGETAKTCR